MQAERKPLSNEELDRLNEFLTSRGGPRAMNIEELDGYLAALVVGPDLVMPSEYLPLLWGDDPEAGPEYQSLEEANTILLLIMRHWNTIAAAVEKNELYLPVILEPEYGMPRGHRWARGFMRGVQLRRASWADLVHDGAEGGAIFSIALLAGDVDPEFLKKPVPPDKQEQLLQYAIAGLHRIQQYFAPQRRSPAMAHTQVTTVRRTTPKAGRNEPCPCGSGRKFKQCCGRAGKPALH